MNHQDPRQKRDRTIAAAVTAAVLLGLLGLLWCGTLDYDPRALAAASTPEISMLEEEETEPEEFIEPEITDDRGESQSTAHDAPAPALRGVPDKAAEENRQVVTPGKNPKPAPPAEKPVTQTRPSPVKATEPSKTDEDRRRATSAMANKFSGPNGAADGKAGSSGSGGTGVGIAGAVAGRTFKGCSKPQVELQNKVVVEVRVTIDAAGRVTAATARSKSGNASAAILRACEQAARTARWSEDPDTPSARGTLTFSITPK